MRRFNLNQTNKISAHKICIDGLNVEDEKKNQNYNTNVKFKKIMHTRNTQTDYRDSETQTDPWISCISLFNTHKVNLSKIFYNNESNEIFGYNNIDNSEEKFKLNELQQKLLSIDKTNLRAQIAIAKQIQHIEWLLKEKKIDQINDTKIKMAENLLYKHTVDTQISILKREKLQENLQIKQKTKKLQHLMEHKAREMRKLQVKHKVRSDSIFLLM